MNHLIILASLVTQEYDRLPFVAIHTHGEVSNIRHKCNIFAPRNYYIATMLSLEICTKCVFASKVEFFPGYEILKSVLKNSIIIEIYCVSSIHQNTSLSWKVIVRNQLQHNFKHAVSETNGAIIFLAGNS